MIVGKVGRNLCSPLNVRVSGGNVKNHGNLCILFIDLGSNKILLSKIFRSRDIIRTGERPQITGLAVKSMNLKAGIQIHHFEG